MFSKRLVALLRTDVQSNISSHPLQQKTNCIMYYCGVLENAHESASINQCSKVFTSRSVRHIINLSWTIEQLLCHCPGWKKLMPLLADLFQRKSYVISKPRNSWLWRTVEWSLSTEISEFSTRAGDHGAGNLVSSKMLCVHFCLWAFIHKNVFIFLPSPPFSSIICRVIKNYCLPVL